MEESQRSESYERTARTTFKRLAQRGTWDRATVHAILDEGLVCHVAFALEGRPFCLPTAYARQGDRLLLHGSPGNHMMRSLVAGAEACVTVTLVDGLVLARSAFHHSINYRSVVLFGRGVEVTDPDEKWEALRDIVEHLTPGRWEASRQPTPGEVTGTKVVALSIEEAGAKVRTGPPIDDEEDHALPIWAGVVPLRPTAGVLEPCPRLRSGIAAPETSSVYPRPSY